MYTSKKFSYTYDDYEDGNKDATTMLEEIMKDSELSNLEEIVIGSNSLTGVQSVKATGLFNLRSFVIGEGSLMNVKE